MKRNFNELRDAKWAGSEPKFVSVGLDSDYIKIPKHIKGMDPSDPTGVILNFNKYIVDATKDIVGEYKPNIAFYEEHGSEGIVALKKTIEYINETAPDVPVILDFKRGDIGNTNIGYVKAAFEYFNADAVTVSPYMGSEAMKPFLDMKEKGIIVLCRTSSPGSGEFQDLPQGGPNEGKMLFEVVAEIIRDKWNYNGNCMLVAGATYPAELKKVRMIVGDMGILVPAVGKQGGTIEQVMENGLNSKGVGVVVNNSRDVIFAGDGEDFVDKARAKVIEMNTKAKLTREKILAVA